MSEMIDRAAEIIETMVHERMKSTKPEDNMNYRRAFTPIARAVIEALRNPTKAMVDAACETDRKTDQYCATGEEHWQAMIDEALR